MCSFILITQAGWLVNIKGLSGAVKRAYCCIPALTTATSQGFPICNSSQLVLLNSQTTYLFGTKHFVYSPCSADTLKFAISVNLCPFNAVTVYNNLLPTVQHTKHKQNKTNRKTICVWQYCSRLPLLIHVYDISQWVIYL